METLQIESVHHVDDTFHAISTATNLGSRCCDVSEENQPMVAPEGALSSVSLSSPSTTTTTTISVDTVHDAYRVALFYCYIPLLNDDVMNIMNFHSLKTPTTSSSTGNNSVVWERLGGRIRIASEGLNGVLSGTLLDLQQYEIQLRNLLFQIYHNSTGGNDGNETKPNTPTDVRWELDVKYCLLRTDLSIASQLFANLQVQMTDTVVGLFDKDMIRNYVNQDQANVDNDIHEEEGDVDSVATLLPQQHRRRNGRRRKQQQQQKQICEQEDCRQRQNLEKIRTIYETSFQTMIESPELPQSYVMNGGAPHLSPEEWNLKLQKLVLQNQQVENKVSTVSSATTNHHNIVLLDCRNCYESAIGYFEVPGATTVLTNTRKYSELPYVIMDQLSDTVVSTCAITGSNNSAIASTTSALRHASHIFMYCTGGVRCERASVFLQAALRTSSSSLESQQPLPEIYQLHGGIQRYLEQYGKEQGSNPTNPDMKSKYYYKGKNFVFDLRRTDPMIMDDGNIAGNAVVGQCLVCQVPYDDYDHGHAPISHRETRCYKCRILILVCPPCRTDVLCWGDATVSCNNDASSRKKLYCGGLEPKECLYIPPVKEILF